MNRHFYHRILTSKTTKEGVKIVDLGPAKNANANTNVSAFVSANDFQYFISQTIIIFFPVLRHMKFNFNFNFLVASFDLNVCSFACLLHLAEECECKCISTWIQWSYLNTSCVLGVKRGHQGVKCVRHGDRQKFRGKIFQMFGVFGDVRRSRVQQKQK